MNDIIQCGWLGSKYRLIIYPIPPHTLRSPHGLNFTWCGCCGLCFWHKATELAHSFFSVLVSASVFMALSTVFHSINSPNNSPLSHSVLRVLFLPYWSFQLYTSLYIYGWLGFKAPTDYLTKPPSKKKKKKRKTGNHTFFIRQLPPARAPSWHPVS